MATHQVTVGRQNGVALDKVGALARGEKKGKNGWWSEGSQARQRGGRAAAVDRRLSGPPRPLHRRFLLFRIDYGQQPDRRRANRRFHAGAGAQGRPILVWSTLSPCLPPLFPPSFALTASMASQYPPTVCSGRMPDAPRWASAQGARGNAVPAAAGGARVAAVAELAEPPPR